MGRDLNWYVLPKTIEHDTSKQLCFEYEYEEDEDVIQEQVYEKVTGESALFDYKDREGETRREYFKRKQGFEENVRTTVSRYIHNDSHKNEWCPKCRLFVSGIYDSPYIIDSIHIGHSCGNPYWYSKWNIENFYLGSSDGDFVKKFKGDKLYREVIYNSVLYSLKDIQKLGEPQRRSDKEALEETMEILNFLQKWTVKNDVVVVFEDEY